MRRADMQDAARECPTRRPGRAGQRGAPLRPAIGRRAGTVVVVGALALGIMVVAGGCDRTESWLHPNQCALSGRPIHRGMGVTFRRDDEKTQRACCLRCTINEARHTNTRFEVLAVTDHASGEEIPAEDAVYLTGSEARLCAAPRVDVPPTRRGTLAQSWDRCLPSIVAFAHDEDARRLQQEVGGTMQTFADLTGGTTVVATEKP